MQLFYTPRSHFSRKVRILLHALELECELIDAGNVGDSVKSQYGPNPLMKVPTLVAADAVVFDSDHIARYLVTAHDPDDRYDVLTENVSTLNARSVMNGIMSCEVDIILAQRAGMQVESLARFQKLHAVMVSGMDWLEQHAAVFNGPLTYLDFHLVSMWDHLVLYDTIPMHCELLQKRVNTIAESPHVAATAPPALE